MSVEGKLDKLQESVDKITEVLAGDDFGNDGLVTQHRTLKTEFYKLRDIVQQHKVIFGGISLVLTIVMGLLGIFG